MGLRQTLHTEVLGVGAVGAVGVSHLRLHLFVKASGGLTPRRSPEAWRGFALLAYSVGHVLCEHTSRPNTIIRATRRLSSLPPDVWTART